MTAYLLRAGLVVTLLAGIASEAAAQGRPGGRGPGGGGMGSMGGGSGGGRCGGGMNSSMQGTRSAGMNSPQQSATNNLRAYQQQAALAAYQTQMQLAQYQLAQQATQTRASMMVSLSTAPRQGPSAASGYSTEWITEYAVEPPVRTVTPGKVPVALAVNPPMHLAYSIASSASLEKKIQEYLAAGEVVLLDSPLKVHVETTVRGLAYVRPTEGRHQGKFFVVDERYVK